MVATVRYLPSRLMPDNGSGPRRVRRAVSETLGALMQRSGAEAALLDAVLKAMPISDLALDAAVEGIPVLDVPRSGGFDICFADQPDIL